MRQYWWWRRRLSSSLACSQFGGLAIPVIRLLCIGREAAHIELLQVLGIIALRQCESDERAAAEREVLVEQTGAGDIAALHEIVRARQKLVLLGPGDAGRFRRGRRRDGFRRRRDRNG